MICLLIQPIHPAGIDVLAEAGIGEGEGQISLEDAGMSPPESKVDPFNTDADGTLRKPRITYDASTVASKLQQGLTSATDHYHYILFYMDNLAAGEKLTGDYDTDMGNGIYHMKLGQNCGLLKNAAFKKTNQQYLREARFSQQLHSPQTPKLPKLHLSSLSTDLSTARGSQRAPRYSVPNSPNSQTPLTNVNEVLVSIARGRRTSGDAGIGHKKRAYFHTPFYKE